MSFDDALQQRAREDTRRHCLLSAHLSAGQWKAEAWTLADSLAWAIAAMPKLAQEGVRWDDVDIAEFELAQQRLLTVRQELKA